MPCDMGPSQNVENVTCEKGACGYDACEAHFSDCDMSVANGCETSINTLVDCGRCGTKCEPANAAAPSCASGTCDHGGCTGTFGNCDADAENGCETNLAATAEHCGKCGKVCTAPANTNAVCVESTCDALCKTGFNDCNMDMSDGCENLGKCGVTAFGEFRPQMKCQNFVNNGNSYQQYCFTLKNVVMCIGQSINNQLTCKDTPTGVHFTFDFQAACPMRFTANTPTCQNYHPGFLKNLQLALGYNKHTITQTKSGNSCTRTYIDINGAFKSMTGDSTEMQIYDITFHD